MIPRRTSDTYPEAIRLRLTLDELIALRRRMDRMRATGEVPRDVSEVDVYADWLVKLASGRSS